MLRRVPCRSDRRLGTRPLGYLTEPHLHPATPGCTGSTWHESPGDHCDSAPATTGLVADLVVEWLVEHGQPYRLTLTGPAGGSWQRGDGDENLELDAVELARAVSGRRAPDHELLRHSDPF